MSDVHALDLDREPRKPERLIYLGNTPRPYGVNEPDLYAADIHLAAVLANSLRMLSAMSHAVIDHDEYERIASKLEFYAIEPERALYENIDWSNDPTHGQIVTDENGVWQSPAGEPGFDEYYAKSQQIKHWQKQYMKEALAWLSEHWGELWD